MPRLVTDQRAMFESNELFRLLSNDSITRYVGHMDNSIEERRLRFQASCRNGRAEIAFVSCGVNLVLIFYPWNSGNMQGISPSKEYVNFEKERGKVYLQAPFILNGVCVCYKGWINMEGLDGMGHIEFDEERARIEALQQPGPSGQQLVKMSIPKHNLKHPATGNPSELHSIDKRPRLQ